MPNIVSKIGAKPVLKTLSNVAIKPVASNNNKLTKFPYISKNQELPLDLFFIRMNHYPDKLNWAQDMIDLTYKLSDLVSEKTTFSNIVQKAEAELKRINNGSAYCEKRILTKLNKFFFQKNTRGEEYHEKFYNRWVLEGKPLTKFAIKSNSEYKNAATCKITYTQHSDGFLIEYGKSSVSNFSLAAKEYTKLINTKNPDIKEINKSIATIHWLIAQESPYKKGNDSIANVITKAIYHSYNVKLSPIKPKHSFDFEAFCTDLDDYIKKYPKLFSINPYIINRMSRMV